VPDLALCSAAVRTRQTADLVVAATGNRLPVDTYRSLYGADPDLVLQYVREIDEGVRSALVVGHNPTMFELVWELSSEEGGDRPPSGPSELEAHGFPTCALAVLALRVDSWEDVAAGCGSVVGLFKPPY
jgi:phosphohistidine phosphatase